MIQGIYKRTKLDTVNGTVERGLKEIYGQEERQIGLNRNSHQAEEYTMDEV